MNREERIINAEFRTATGSGRSPKIEGYAALFDTPADLGPFVEVVKRGAFASAIQTDDVRALFNHDPNYVLGRNRAGTLRMSEDSKGLAIEIDPPDTSWARDLLTSLRRGDVNQMSFGFVAKQVGNSTRSGRPLRSLEKVQLIDVSVVSWPAYKETSAAVRGVRSIEQIYAEMAHHRQLHPTVAERKRQLEILGMNDVQRERLRLLAA